MRVKKSDKDDWGKLIRVLQYLNRTKYLKLHISVDDLGILKWYVMDHITFTGIAQVMQGGCSPKDKVQSQAT
jgi:hypothetical protein